MALVRNGRSTFQNPGVFYGTVSGQSGNTIKGGLRNRVVGGFNQTFSAYPSGSLAPGAFILPQKPGAISSYVEAIGVITAQLTAALTPARNLEATPSASITVTDAQLDQIVSLLASSSCAISVTNAQLAAAAGMSLTGTLTIAVDDAQLGAIFSVTASRSMSISGTGSTLTALAFMEAEAGGPTPLSPEALAAAVWNAVLADYNEAGSTGEALSNASSAGNPWDALLVDNTNAGSFGEHVQKLLKKSLYLGTKG